MGSIIVFGSSGQLGQSLKNVADKNGLKDIIFLGTQDANILDRAALENTFAKYKPEHVINCAAYTAVDKAEDEVEAARNVNNNGAANVAELCKAYNSCLIHVSTDFVFKGNVPKLLNETDPTQPLSVYGLTKLEGEQAITAVDGKYFILRTSWLYSEFANNFVKTMLKLAETKTELGVIADQVGTPTYAIDLAEAIFQIIRNESKAYGLYHYSNEGVLSWYDFAVAIFHIAGVEMLVKPLKTTEYPTKAERPKFSVMDKSKIKKDLGIDIPYWRDSLITCIKALQ
ncbi:dTDP-4-dehydrorhamnose reductase [Mucilaginibacter ginkgonis]|uniref:dTDP-4-dehydrorhamnose reductase n=1 Tax=Mucilaginibacter ginkgonis TaxID=2682091 RepID=A0A6I4HX31_9SPHI|nr:dTDP-4-dehydrorhamnose reductase [Mucilaginibacter ginkgonis]QQL48268.1 dTDP-4-dehydrorhamnose reductase [Mucilaginibacter ginkgonis]